MSHKMRLYLHRFNRFDSSLCIRVNRSSQQVGIELVSGGFDVGETVGTDGAQDDRERR